MVEVFRLKIIQQDLQLFFQSNKTQREGFEPPGACAHRLSRPAPYRARRPLQKVVICSD
ncbi:Hypothetical protein Nlim_1228 [Candidatus Nitrosarchaeum limnium SFB1]|uniref:Uncharacterized protein n=1 Tax=Candidatus Nitrosarchaeum limnium SFB1 TaxID=886738 RepID=F3KKZ3_9ARCH|nr:Hypothetical protein Nlim_1228 [Candidatus Nitrosarchaeum limnium SFB1]